MRRERNRILVAGGAALALAIAVFGVALGRALAGTPSTDVATANALATEPSTVGTSSVGVDSEAPGGSMSGERSNAMASAGPTNTLTGDVLGLAVDEAPFAANRRAPSQRYQMPGERVRERPEPVELPDAPDFEMLGAVSGPGVGFAWMRTDDDDDPTLVMVGDDFEGYTLASIQDNEAVMTGLGRSLNVALVEPESEVRRPSRRGNNDDDPRRRTRTRSNNDDEENTAEQRMREALESAQGMLGQLGGQISIGDDGAVTIQRQNGAAQQRATIRLLQPGR